MKEYVVISYYVLWQ